MTKRKAARDAEDDDNVEDDTETEALSEEYDLNSRFIVAGIITQIHMEDFMCHRKFTIQLGSRVNFITGQNGSGNLIYDLYFLYL